MKKKWTNIRDYYRKEVQKAKNVPTGSAAKKSKTYVYSELLHFLTPVFGKRVSEGNYPQEKVEDLQSMQTPHEEQNTEPEAVNHMESPEPTLPVVNQKRKKDVPTQILNMLQQKQKQTPANTDEDDDTKYLLSFRSYMKTMNAHQKIDFKLGMLQLVKTVTMENDPSSPQPRYTNYYHYDNSSGSLPLDGNSSSPSPTLVPSLQNIHVPEKSRIYLQHPSPSPPTFRSFLQQQNIPSTNTTNKPIIYAPKQSPTYLPSPSPSPPTFHSFSQPQNIPLTNTSRKPIVIHSITNITPPQSTTQQSPGQDYPELSIPGSSAEDSEAAQFLVLQSEDSQKDTFQEFLQFK